MSRQHAALLGLLLVHLLLLSWILWYFEPRPELGTKVVEGQPATFKSCSARHCDSGIELGPVLLACGVGPLATSFSCPEFYRIDRPARASYFRMPTVVSATGLAAPSNVLLAFEQDGVVLWQRTPQEHRSDYYWIGSWVLIAIFICSFFALARLPSFRKPSPEARPERR